MNWAVIELVGTSFTENRIVVLLKTTNEATTFRTKKFFAAQLAGTPNL